MSGQASYQARWAVMPAGGTFNGSTPTWDFVSDTLAAKEQILVGSGLRGYRQRQLEAESNGLYDVSGQLVAEPSIGFLSFWLPYVMGGGSTTVPAFAATVPDFDIVCDRVAGIYKYQSCKISKFSMKFASGQLVRCTMDVIGKAYTSTTFAGAALGTTHLYQPLQSASLVIANATQNMAVEDFELVIDNVISPKRRCKLTNQDLIETDRQVSFRASCAWDSAQAANFANGGFYPDSGVTVTLTNTAVSSTVSAAFTFSQVKIPINHATPQADEFILPIEALCRGTSAGVEFTALLDITP